MNGLDATELERILNSILGAGAIVLIAATLFLGGIALVIYSLARARRGNVKSETLVLAEAINTSIETDNQHGVKQSELLKEISEKLEKQIEIETRRNGMLTNQSELLNKLIELGQSNNKELERRNIFVEKFAGILNSNTAIIEGVRDAVVQRLELTSHDVKEQGKSIMGLSDDIKGGMAVIRDEFEKQLNNVNKELETIATELKSISARQSTYDAGALTSAQQLQASFQRVSAQIDALPGKFEIIINGLKDDLSAVKPVEEKKEDTPNGP